MVFSSNLFILAFLPVFFVVYYLMPYRLKNAWALVGSAAFYAWGAPLFVFVLFASIAFDFFAVKQFEHFSKRRGWLYASVILNVGLLAYFKYSNFFVDNLNTVLQQAGFDSVGWTAVVLPIGISFFTFQKISYVIDVYRGVRKPLNSLADHALYVILFPQLIAGPIVRYSEIADELKDRKHNLNADNRLLGLFRFSLGLGKKVLIANVLGAEADKMFDIPVGELKTDQAWYGAVCYTFQIYFDFSGYSDMAIGLGRMMGFRFPENFNNPYISKSITEFWRRWHITLSNWMRDYLYIPLGGNRVSTNRLYLNLWTVFLFSGLWHGAAWTFVIWGAYHGFFLVIERMFLLKLYKRIPGVIRTALIFFIIMIGWVFFRASDLYSAIGFIKSMFAFNFAHFDKPHEVELALPFAIAFSFFALLPKVEGWQHRMLFNAPGLWRTLGFSILTFVLLAVSISVIASSGFNPFIYFRF
jgi:alginate O-acetyltransferase complex protein AlgI